MRKLTTFEKAQFLNFPFFQDVCELEAMEAAKFWIDYQPIEGDNLEEVERVKQFSKQLLSSGQVERMAIVKIWLILNDREVDVIEKENYGLQLQETAKAMLEEIDGRPSTFREVMKKTIAKKSEIIVNAPAEALPAAEDLPATEALAIKDSPNVVDSSKPATEKGFFAKMFSW